MTERRPLGLPDFSQPLVPAATATRPRLLPVDRALFQAPPTEPVELLAPGRRTLATGGLTFSHPVGPPTLA
ncbi:hypothetical protein ACEZCY_35650 [Streptacidiphilus sp. N1-12]|uniref:Uncharacterized protein n=1 Tax=Streptacidiphilus alkalitolerans TaxID=3342712 RepID=A0ABV6WR41_9ACTN